MWNAFSILDWHRTFHPSLYTRNLPCASSLPYSARTNLQITGLLVTCLCRTTCVPKCCFHRLFAHQTLQRLCKACLAAHDQIHMNQTTTCNALSFWLATGCFKSKHHLPALLIPRQCLAFSFAELDGSQETQSCDVAWACHGLSIAFYPVVYHHFPYQNLVKWECTMVYPWYQTQLHRCPRFPCGPCSVHVGAICFTGDLLQRFGPSSEAGMISMEDMVLEETPVCPKMETIIVMIPKKLF